MAAFLEAWRDPDRAPASLTTVPDEILLNIVDALITSSLDDETPGTATLPANPHDPWWSDPLYNLHLTSKRFYDCFEPYVYVNVGLYSDYAVKSFVAKLLKDPSIGYAVKRIEFMSQDLAIVDLGNFMDYFLRLSSAELLNSVRLEGTGLDCVKDLGVSNPSAELGLIMMLTPNLQTFLLNGSVYMDPNIARNQIGTWNYDQLRSPHGKAMKGIALGESTFTRSALTVTNTFRALKNITICLDGIVMADLTPIFALPSLRRFAGFGRLSGKQGDDTACAVPKSSSNITSLSLKRFYAGMDNLKNLVEGCKRLEELDLHIPYTEDDIDVHHLCRIGRHHFESLRLLGLDFYSTVHGSLGNLGDLKDFKLLERVHLPPMAIAQGLDSQPQFNLATQLPLHVTAVDLYGYSTEDDMVDLPMMFITQLNLLATLWESLQEPIQPVARTVLVHESAFGTYFIDGQDVDQLDHDFRLAGATLTVCDDFIDL
ncbi:uncharacterized protein BDZ99DRAFT_461446 [Mytilinidion resinicola]|uniref:Uncharacterized protein n=1 Tax=Mytilinidion resinicola TaxID=574789 RepID=A0A6A6YRG2_9PEZI|nr:uncharacterized protein BDZ99DRAFT_461446 [Mytilinidion resinicola]KAF2811361.1 hypothetical protein BDZ99DRAFT_461446 [Mytilinidion resinicola]